MGVSITALNASDATPAASGTSDADGKTILTLEAGGVYYIQVESPNHSRQVSDEFQVLGDHSWTMALTPGAGAMNPLSLLILIIGIVLILISGVLFVRR